MPASGGSHVYKSLLKCDDLTVPYRLIFYLTELRPYWRWSGLTNQIKGAFQRRPHVRMKYQSYKPIYKQQAKNEKSGQNRIFYLLN